MRLTIYIPDEDARLLESAGVAMGIAGSTSEVIREALKLSVSLHGRRAMLQLQKEATERRLAEIATDMERVS